jgi:hypothetical protein
VEFKRRFPESATNFGFGFSLNASLSTLVNRSCRSITHAA